MRSQLRDWALLIFCNMIWGSGFVMSKLAQRQTGPVFTTFFPITLATLALIPIVHYQNKKANKGNPSFRLPGRDIIAFGVIGLFGQLVTQVSFNWGVRLSLASNGALLMLTLPVSTAIMAYFLLGERMTWVRWVSFAFAIAGVLECSGIDWKNVNMTSSRFMMGNLLLFISVLSSAFYNVYSKRLLRRYSPFQVLLYSYVALFVFMLPLVIYAEPQGFSNLPTYTGVVWLGLLLLAIFQYFLSMVILLSVLTRLDATQAGLTNYLIPFFGLVAAGVVLHERLTLAMILGGTLVLASTLLVTVYEQHIESKARAAVVECRTR